jgi:hypothetical protein
MTIRIFVRSMMTGEMRAAMDAKMLEKGLCRKDVNPMKGR